MFNKFILIWGDVSDELKWMQFNIPTIILKMNSEYYERWAIRRSQKLISFLSELTYITHWEYS